MYARLLVLVVAVVCMAAGCRDAETPSQAAEGPGAPAPGAPAPATAGLLTDSKTPASLPDLMLPDLEGRRRPLRTTPDEVTVLNFWATWCVPCLKELPELVALHQRWRGRGVHVVGIAIDSGAPAAIRAFAAQHGLDYSLRLGRSQWARTHFQVFGLPVTLIVDRHGAIRHRLIGPQTGAQFAAAVQPYLKSP